MGKMLPQPLFEDSPPPARGLALGVDFGANQGGMEGFDSIRRHAPPRQPVPPPACVYWRVNVLQLGDYGAVVPTGERKESV